VEKLGPHSPPRFCTNPLPVKHPITDINIEPIYGLWALRTIFLPHEHLRKQTTHSLPFVRKDQLEIMWKLLSSQSPPAHCVVEI